MGPLRSYATASAIMLASLGAADRAKAQFAGDFFFLDPSVNVQVGGTATLDLALFSGSDAFGAGQVEVTYDSSLAELISVSLPSGTGAPALLQYTETGDGLIKIIAVNAASTTGPIGAVVVARLEMRPTLGSVGIVEITATHKAAFTAAAAAYSSSQATNAEIVVVSSSTARAEAAGVALELLADPSPALLARALALAPPGGVVELAVTSGPLAGRIVLVQVPPLR